MTAVVICLLKLPADGGHPVAQVVCRPTPYGHGAVAFDLDDDVPASSLDGNGRARRRYSGDLAQRVDDEAVHGLLDPLGKPLIEQLDDRDRAWRILGCAADSARESFNGQSCRADPVRQLPQVRERLLGGEVSIGQPGRQDRVGPARRACPGQAERITQGYQALLCAVMQIALQAGPRGIGRLDHQLPRGPAWSVICMTAPSNAW